MQSPSYQYQLKHNRNPFQLHKQQKLINLNKNKELKFLSNKKQKILSSSTPKLRTFYNLETQRQPTFGNMKEIQLLKNKFFQFKNHKDELQEIVQQKNTDYQTSLSIKQSLNKMRSSINIFKNHNKQLPISLTNSKSERKKVRFGNKQILLKQQKQIKQISSIKRLSIFRTQKLKDLSSLKQVRKSSMQVILKSMKKKKNSEGNLAMSKIIGKLYQSSKYEYQFENQYFQEQLNFTFGKPSTKKSV